MPLEPGCSWTKAVTNDRIVPEWQRWSEQLFWQAHGTIPLAEDMQVADRELCARARRPRPNPVIVPSIRQPENVMCVGRAPP